MMVLVADDEELDVNGRTLSRLWADMRLYSIYLYLSIFTWEGCSQNAYSMELLSNCLKLLMYNNQLIPIAFL